MVWVDHVLIDSRPYNIVKEPEASIWEFSDIVTLDFNRSRLVMGRTTEDHRPFRICSNSFISPSIFDHRFLNLTYTMDCLDYAIVDSDF